MKNHFFSSIIGAALLTVSATAQGVYLNSATLAPGAGVDVNVDTNVPGGVTATLRFKLYRTVNGVRTLVGQTTAVSNSGGNGQEYRVIFADPNDAGTGVKAQAGDEVTAELDPSNGPPIESNADPI